MNIEALKEALLHNGYHLTDGELDNVFSEIGVELVVVRNVGEDGEWGVSFTDSNPEQEDFVACLSKESAFKLKERIERGLQSLATCQCGEAAEAWFDNEWAFVGCRKCGIAAAAHRNINQAKKDWSRMTRN